MAYGVVLLLSYHILSRAVPSTQANRAATRVVRVIIFELKYSTFKK